mgnify:CR=1 FL=1
MESIKQKLEEYVNPATNRKISKNSIEKVYMIKYKKISQGMKKTGVDFLKDYDSVMKWINDNFENISTKKSYISTVINILKSHDMDAEKYSKRVKELSNEINKITAKHLKNAKQEANYVPIEKLRSVIKIYEKKANTSKTDEEQYQNLKKWIVANLYVGDKDNPPVRLDYSVDLIQKSDYDPESKGNFLVLNKREPEFFHFGDHKTSASTGTKKVRVGKTLKKALKIWLVYNRSTKYLLLNDRGGKMTPHTLGVFITKVFSILKKHITLNDLRHIFVSELISDEDIRTTKRRKILAQRMGHSLDVQEQYKKN